MQPHPAKPPENKKNPILAQNPAGVTPKESRVTRKYAETLLFSYNLPRMGKRHFAIFGAIFRIFSYKMFPHGFSGWGNTH